MLNRDEFVRVNELLTSLTTIEHFKVEDALWLIIKLKDAHSELLRVKDLVKHFMDQVSKIQDEASQIENTAIELQRKANAWLDSSE